MAYILAFANQKGGVAKTTTTASVGGVLAQWGKRTLLVDLDPQGNLTLALGLDPRRSVHTSADMLLNLTAPQDLVVQTQVPNLELIPGGSNLALAERYLPGRPQHQTVLQRLLRPLAEYDYILLDCSPSLGSVTFNALMAAHLVVIPTQAEYFSAYALRNMLWAIQRVRQNGNPGLLYRVVITMFRQRNRAHRIIRARLEATFGHGLCQTIIETDTKLREAAIAGLPITHFAPKTRAALQYEELTKELLAYAAQEEEASRISAS